MDTIMYGSQLLKTFGIILQFWVYSPPFLFLIKFQIKWETVLSLSILISNHDNSNPYISPPLFVVWPTRDKCSWKTSYESYKSFDNLNYSCFNGNRLLSKPQPNLNTTVGFDMKMTLQTPPTPPHPTHPPHKLNISNISAVTDLILMKL